MFRNSRESVLPYLQPGQLIDIGGRRINMLGSGSRGPTAILMAGIFGWSAVWYKTQPVMSSPRKLRDGLISSRKHAKPARGSR
jgi:hypothetical protein